MKFHANRRKSRLFTSPFTNAISIPDLTRRALLFGTAASLLPTSSSWAVEPVTKASAGELARRVAAIEKRVGGRVGVAVVDTANGQGFVHRANERFPMCSTFKWLLVAQVLSRIDAQQEQANRFVSYTQDDLLDYAPITQQHLQEGGMTIDALCAAAVTYSDNTAANLLLRSVGGPAALTAYLRSLGDTITRLDRMEPELNSALPGDVRDTTTPASMLQLQRIILLGEALSASSRRQLLDWLIANTTGDAKLRAGIPAGWRVGDKTGSGANGASNDVAIAWPPNRVAPILASVYMVESSAARDELNQAFAEIGQLLSSGF